MTLITAISGFQHFEQPQARLIAQFVSPIILTNECMLYVRMPRHALVQKLALTV